MLIGKRLKSLRLERGLSQQQMAEALNLTQSAIANYENNIRQPNLKLLLIFSDYFEVSSDYILSRSARDEKYTDVDVDLIDVVDYFVNLLLKASKSSAEAYAKAYLETHGLKDLYFSLFRLSLTKLGWLWETNQISSAKEHLMSDTIEELIIKFKENKAETKSKKVLLSTVVGERHTFGLKMVSNLLSMEGYDCDYLGEGVPIEDMKTLIFKNNSDLLILSITSDLYQNRVLEWLDKLNNTPVTLVGAGVKNLDTSKYSQVKIFRDYEACYDYYKERISND